ncbi:transposase, partial [Enterococcus lactis]|uniref:transposase n=1 Tax=Enterococcus lactis TaxID=357441 RepID=UPI001C7D8626
QETIPYTVNRNSHNRLRRTNLLERLHQEVRRREKIMRIFHDRTSASRLIGAILMELHDEWLSTTRKYIKFDQ